MDIAGRMSGTISHAVILMAQKDGHLVNRRNAKMDYEDMILARQELIELWEDGCIDYNDDMLEYGEVYNEQIRRAAE